MTIWNAGRPDRAGVYRVVSDGVEGFALWDQADRIWGCTQPTIELAASSPEFFFSCQEKSWVEISDDQTYLAVAKDVPQLGAVSEAQKQAHKAAPVSENDPQESL